MKSVQGGDGPEMVADVLYLEVNVAALIVMIVVLIKSAGFSRMASQKNFVVALSTQIGFALTGSLFEAVKRGILPFNGPVMLLLKTLNLMLTSAVVYFWFLYFEQLQGTTVQKNRKTLIFTSSLLWIELYIGLANIFDHSLFFIDESGAFTYGPWFYVAQYLPPLIYIYFTCSRALKNAYNMRHSPEGRIYLFYLAFPIVPLVSGFLEYHFPEYPLIYISLALATLIMYVNSMDAVVSVDPLTQLFNRRQFMRMMSLWFSTRNEAVPMYFMMMDVDRFKMVNDVYGHTEGDMALVRVAEALRTACNKQRKKSVISRYGGDEFMILAEAAGEDEIKKLITQIDRTLKELNDESGAPYKLGLSIGYARLDEAKSIKAVIDLADKRLYEIKEVHHRIIDEAQAGETAKKDS